MTVVPRVLLDHVGENVAERECLGIEAPGDVKGPGGIREFTGSSALCMPDLERFVGISVLDVERGATTAES